MIKQLQVIKGPDEGRVFQLPDKEEVQIGRSGSTATRLNDLRVSRNHCKVQVEGTRVILTDLNSMLGTFVNDQKITAKELVPGDVIRLGDTEMRFVVEDMQEAATLGGSQVANLVGNLSGRNKEPLAELTGKRLGDFEVGPVLARTDQHVTFRARDLTQDRPVALKVFIPGAARDEDLQRLFKVLEPRCALRHPNLVGLYGAGKADGLAWVATEFVEGDDLQQLLDKSGPVGMLDWPHALRVALHLARALDYLHKQQIFHRHIHPQTVVIGTADKQPRLGALIEARSAGQVGAGFAPRTEDLLRDGAFLPPERVKDESQGDARSDVYSLGATVYMLLTGQPPFKGKTAVETIAEILQNVPPSPREYQLALPEPFERVILKMMAKQPEARYQSAAELLADLERVTANPTGAAVANGRPASAPDLPPPSTQDGVISVTCKCGQRLQARDRYAGTRVRCPACKAFVVLPGGRSTMLPENRGTMPELQIPTQTSLPAVPPPPQRGPLYWVLAVATAAALVVGGWLYVKGLIPADDEPDKGPPAPARKDAGEGKPKKAPAPVESSPAPKPPE